MVIFSIPMLVPVLVPVPVVKVGHGGAGQVMPVLFRVNQH